MCEQDRDIIVASGFVSALEETVKAAFQIVSLFQTCLDMLVAHERTKSVRTEQEHIAVYYIIYVKVRYKKCIFSQRLYKCMTFGMCLELLFRNGLAPKYALQSPI